MTTPFTIHMKRGSTYTCTISRDGVSNTTGWDAKIDFREKNKVDSTLYFSLSVGAGIVLSTVDNALVLTVTIPASTSAAFTFDSAYFDVKLTKPDATVEYILDGILSITPQVTA